MLNETPVNYKFTINLEALKNCFEIIRVKNQQSQQLLTEVQKYIEECKKDTLFPSILIGLFENMDENIEIRWLALVEFKNCVKDGWVFKSSARNINLFSDQLKKDIKAMLLSFLDKYQEKMFRSQINDALRNIAFHDFPVHYQDLVLYFLNNLQGLKEALTDDQVLFSDVTSNFIKTFKIIMTERSKKKLGDARNLFYNVYFKLMESFHEFWEYFHNNMQRFVELLNQDNFLQLQQYFKLARKADRIYLSFLCNGCEDMAESQNIVDIIALVIQKTADLTTNTKNVRDAGGSEDLCKEMNKNLYKMLETLGQLQTIFPLIFRNSLGQYLELLEFILNNPDSFIEEYTLSAAVICLNNVIRRCVYQEDIVVHKKPQFGNLEAMKKQCASDLMNYFSQEKIQNFLNIFILKLLPRRPNLSEEQNVDNPDDFIEIESDRVEFEKLETPLYNLTLRCTLEFLTKFSEHTLPLVHDLTAKVLNNELQNLSPLIHDGIFAIVGQLPTLYQQIKMDPSNYLDLGSVLKYLEDKASSDLNLSKRIPVLIHKWVGLFDQDAKTQIVHNIIQITQSLKNNVVRYECCMCIKVILKTKQKLNLDFLPISEILVPIAIELLGCFQSPQVIEGLIDLLKQLFTAVEHPEQNDMIISQMLNQNIQALTKRDDQLLLPALADMFKTVIASFKFNTPLSSIFEICLAFIDYHFKDGKFYPALTSLWLFLLREYTPIQGVGDALRTMFVSYSEAYLNLSNPEELSQFINIIEEYILAELILTDDYLSIVKIMEEKYELALKVSVPNESIFNLKSAILSLMSTLILIFMRQNVLENLKVFDKMVMYLLIDLLNDFFDQDFKSIKPFKVSMLTLINRYIILNLEGFLEIIEKHQISFNNFLEYWTNNMHFLISPQTRRINAVAVFYLVPFIKNKEMIVTFFENFLSATMPELMFCMAKGHKPPVYNDQKILGVTERCMDVRDSERKIEIRQVGLYLDVDLKELFKSSFKEAIAANNLTDDEIKFCVKDQQLVDMMVQIFNE